MRVKGFQAPPSRWKGNKDYFAKVGRNNRNTTNKASFFTNQKENNNKKGTIIKLRRR